MKQIILVQLGNQSPCYLRVCYLIISVYKNKKYTDCPKFALVLNDHVTPCPGACGRPTSCQVGAVFTVWYRIKSLSREQCPRRQVANVTAWNSSQGLPATRGWSCGSPLALSGVMWQWHLDANKIIKYTSVYGTVNDTFGQYAGVHD